MAETEIARRRLTAQGIVRPLATGVASAASLASVVEVAASQLATQAQDLAGGRWALGLRAGATESTVEEALATGVIVRTWPMRGTLMIVARRDARWLTELLAPRSFSASAGVWRRDGLVEADFARAADVARAELQGGLSLPRDELLARFAAAGIDPGSGRGSHLLRRLAGEALIVFGEPQGATQTFALLSERAPDAEPRDRDDALAELAARYVAGHGPATVHDLAWWSGLTLTDTRRGIALAGDRIALDRDGLYVAPGGAALSRRPDVRLLPPFDELLLGYRDRSVSLAPEHFDRVVPYSNGLFAPTVTVDGEVVGIWRRTLVGRSEVTVAVDTFAPVAPALEVSIERRADEYAAYLGRSRSPSPR